MHILYFNIMTENTHYFVQLLYSNRGQSFSVVAGKVFAACVLNLVDIHNTVCLWRLEGILFSTGGYQQIQTREKFQTASQYISIYKLCAPRIGK